MNSVKEYIEALAAGGRHHFSLAEAVQSLGRTPTAVRAALRRLKEKRQLAEPARGFFVIVPPEYHRLGCLPSEQFTPQLMAYWGEPYYVALLSAAELHGAAHHRPQVFQVMLRHNRRPVVCGAVRIEFVARRDMEQTPVVERNTPRGILRVAGPEATAFEIVGYADRCGGLDHVSTLLVELSENLDGSSLKKEAKRSPLSWVQRLGYLLELIDRADLASPLHLFVQHVRKEIPLVRSRSRKGALRNGRWKLIVNAEVEPEL